jgi:hypothetical protein
MESRRLSAIGFGWKLDGYLGQIVKAALLEFITS